MLKQLVSSFTSILRNPVAGPSRQEKWNRSWSKPNFAAKWQAQGIPQVLREAVESDWFPAGSSILDIGCGDGALIAWLAQGGYRAKGIDFAAAAIARANALHQHENLSYAVVDICQPLVNSETFDCLFERGCLHGLPDGYIAQYAKNVRTYLKPGGKFLLLHKTLSVEGRSVADERQRVQEKLSTALQPAFTIERTQIIDMLTGANLTTNTTHPGLAFWLLHNE